MCGTFIDEIEIIFGSLSVCVYIWLVVVRNSSADSVFGLCVYLFLSFQFGGYRLSIVHIVQCRCLCSAFFLLSWQIFRFRTGISARIAKVWKYIVAARTRHTYYCFAIRNQPMNKWKATKKILGNGVESSTRMRVKWNEDGERRRQRWWWSSRQIAYTPYIYLYHFMLCSRNGEDDDDDAAHSNTYARAQADAHTTFGGAIAVFRCVHKFNLWIFACSSHIHWTHLHRLADWLTDWLYGCPSIAFN